MSSQGKRVATLDGLHRAVMKRRAVCVPNSTGFGGPRPAAWMINLPGAVLYNLFKVGMYLYIPKGGKTIGKE